MSSLRSYQEKAIELIREEFKKGNRKVLLVMPTGGGKTTVFTHMMKESLKREKKSAMYVRGRQLVQQAHEKLMREETPHGVLMAGHWAKNFQAKIQIASIDTVTSRGNYPDADLIIIDEAHMAVSEGYKTTIGNYPNAFVVGVTATPYTRESLRHIADSFVKPITFQELVDQGFLVPPKYYGARPPDLKGIKKSKGDFVNEQLKERMSVLSGDIVQTWIEKGENRPTVCFAVNIEHSKQIVSEFIKNGIPAEHIEASSSFEARKEAIGRLTRGETKILSNVGILCTGVDIPPLGCLILARPTLSYNLYIQQLGRGTRCFYKPGLPLDTVEQRLTAINESDKKYFIVLDHAANVTRHGFIHEEPEICLDGVEKLNTGKNPKQCDTCFLIYTESYCPVCGPKEPIDREKRQIDIEKEVQLIELNIHDPDAAASMVKFVAQKKEYAKKRGYKNGWVYYQVKEEFGEEVADSIFPNHKKRFRYSPFK